MGSRLSAVLAFPTPCSSPSALGMSPAARTLMGANNSIWAVGSKSVCPPGFRPLTDSPSCDITAVRICVCARVHMSVNTWFSSRIMVPDRLAT